MGKTKFAVFAGAGLVIAFGLGSLTTVANERWDGITVCVDHKTRNVSASSGGECPGSSTLKRMGLEGADGEDGTQIHSGQGSPEMETGSIGDFYLDLVTGKLHGPKAANGWLGAITLRGADGANGSGSQGPTGPAGPAGPQGPSGPQGPAGPGADTRTSYFISKSRVPINATATPSGPTTIFEENEGLEAGVYSYVASVMVEEVNFNGPTPSVYCRIGSGYDEDGTVHYSADSPEVRTHFSFAGWVEFFDGDPDWDFVNMECESYAVDDGNGGDIGDDDGEVQVSVTVTLIPINSVDSRDLDG